MTDELTDRQRRTLDSVSDAPSNAEGDDLAVLADLTGHRSADVRVDAAEALNDVAYVRPELAASNLAVVRRALQEDDLNVRVFALDAIEAPAREAPDRVDGADAVLTVAQALNDRNEWVRAQAAETLGEIGDASPDLLEDTGVVRSLARLVARADDHSDARSQAARAIGRIGAQTPARIDGRTESLLTRAADDEAVAAAVQSALESINEAKSAASANPETPDASAAFCPECGAEFDGGTAPNFCRNCGHEL